MISKGRNEEVNKEKCTWGEDRRTIQKFAKSSFCCSDVLLRKMKDIFYSNINLGNLESVEN